MKRAASIAALLGVVAGGFVNPGTPPGITTSFDCKVRQAAWEYGKRLLPQRGAFRTLYDALQLGACNVTAPAKMDEWTPPSTPIPPGAVVYADAAKGADTNPGTVSAPVQSVQKAIDLASGKAGTVVLRGGKYYSTGTVQIGTEHSGVTVMNYPGERAVVSGAKPLKVPKAAWRQYAVVPRFLDVQTGQNNVFDRAAAGADQGTVKYLGTFDQLRDCESAFNTSSKGPFMSFTWHEPAFGGDYAGQCFGDTSDTWAPHAEAKIISGRVRERNTWVASIKGQVDEIAGLRLDGQRAIRAKYPNGNPEDSGSWLYGAGQGMGGGQYVQGWVVSPTKWVPPFRKPDGEDVVATGKDWPSVEWPLYEGPQTGEGDQGEFHIGVGGYCDDLLDKEAGPTGYWCAMNPPRGQCWNKKTNVGSGCTQTHMSPDGVVFERALNYSDPSTAAVLAWRGGGRWFTQMWKVSHFVRENASLIFDPTTGGQGGEGMTSASQWWIENVKEECDSANEWFYDEKTGDLYFNFNGTGGPTGEEVFEAVTVRELFHVQGTQAAPVKGFSIRGLELRDTRFTYLDAHGMPSGGDWALQRSAAVYFEGTENCSVSGSLLTRLDGNGVFLSAYNRNTTISDNEVSWHGDSAFAAWGLTSKCLNENCTRKLQWPVGPDGRGGNQPRFTTIRGNLVREIGIWQKQSSMWFQAVASQSHISGNVHFNGPRAGINFNDGFGGADLIENNLLANCVRESGDHGPYNSWDRVPYITTVADSSKPSVIPAFRHIRRNFFLSLYSSQEAIDTDDGSAYYETYENFFPYASNGLKSDFNGHDNRHYRNVYAYVSNCWGPGKNNWFVNNTCVAHSSGGGFNSDCGQDMQIHGNKVFNALGTLSGKICDPSNTIAKLPDDDTIIGWGRSLLGF